MRFAIPVFAVIFKNEAAVTNTLPGRVPACQTEVTWGREWVMVMAYQRRGQPRSKAEWGVGFSEMDCKPFYS